ncbi:MAG TPA: ATP-binding protein [Gaiellaceae bacterium]|nr:ATP-binding protein [Gaiellaceae bacterium]
MALRLRSLAAACAVASAGATVAVALVARLDFAIRAPSLHVALETTAAISASAAAFLLLGRYRRTGFLEELLLSAGLLLLALSNLAFAALPAAFHSETNPASVWALLITGVLSAVLICLGALLPRRRIRVGARWPLTVYGGTAVLAFAVTMPLVAVSGILPRPVAVSFPHGPTQPHLAANPTVSSLQLTLAALYILAAYGFARRHRLTGDELSGWLTVACIFSAAARVNYFFHPTFYTSWVYTGDVFRLGFYLALLVGAAREIMSYWMSEIEAASLDERRRIACDVHDGLAQEIAFIGRNVQALRSDDVDPELVDRIMDGVERARQESRRVIGALTAEVQPFEQALEQAAREAARRYGASIDMQLARGIELKPRDQEAVVRLTSEAVANAARHSGADRLHLVLERVQKGLRVRVRDDGVGFDPSARNGRGFGLISMRDRAEALGARLHIRSRDGRGTEVEFEL